MPPEAIPPVVSREAYMLALQQIDRLQTYLYAVASVVSVLGGFVGLRLMGLIQTVTTAVNNNTAALDDLKEAKK